MNDLIRILAALALALGLSTAHASGGEYPLDRFPEGKLHDQAALQIGAKLFVNYCLGCHGASSMRYNRLEDIGLTENQIRANLLFTGDKVGDQMKIAMSTTDAKEWFGALPPDLSVIARARSSGEGSGADWIYTYLRTYYRDKSRPHGWNNALFHNTGMPHVFWQLQGSRGATIEEIRAVKDPKTGARSGFEKVVVTYNADGEMSEAVEKVEGAFHHESKTITLGKASGGMMTQPEYDEAVANLVAYLAYMSDPSAKARTQLGVWVLLFLALFTALAWWLNKEYWKDVK